MIDHAQPPIRVPAEISAAYHALLQGFGPPTTVSDEDFNPETDAPDGFQSTCDNYAAITFLLDFQGRSIMVTVEDVTPV